MRQQPSKDSKTKRVNFDNERESDFDKKYERRPSNKTRRNKRRIKSKDVTASNVRDKSSDAPRKTTSFNDVAWYSRNAELLRSAGSIPFASVLGAPVFETNAVRAGVPGIMSFNWRPNYGPNDGTAQAPFALNQAARSMYSFVVHANSRNTSYTAEDLMVLTLAGMHVFTALSYVIRAYGVAKYYQENNLYLPDALLKDMGFNPTNFRQNLGTIWFQLNELIARTTQIWVPTSFPLLNRWMWMNSFIYTDAESSLGQIYYYRQDRFFKYNPTISNQGGGIQVARENGNGSVQFPKPTLQFDWTTWYKTINDMIDALIVDEDRGVIYGDILKAYGKENIFAMPQIPVDYTVQPVYNKEVLMQFENLTVAPEIATPIGLIQRAGLGLFPAYPADGKSEALANVLPRKIVINFHQNDQPTPEQIMIATRCTSTGLVTGGPSLVFSSGVPVVTEVDPSVALTPVAGSEVITGVYVSNYMSGSKREEVYPNVVASGSDTVWTTGLVPYVSNQTFCIALGSMNAFDWHPFVYLMKITADVTVSTGDVIYAYGDYDNYTTVDSTILRKLHDTAVFSLFGVPQI